MSDTTKDEQIEDAIEFTLHIRGHAGSGKSTFMMREALEQLNSGDPRIKADLSKVIFNWLLSTDKSFVTDSPPHIVSTHGIAGGKPRIDGHRITVQNIATWHERMGMSVDEIATAYDLTLSQVYAALAYYHDHREEIEASIKADAAFVEELKQRQPSLLAERLKALHDG